ncbi:hypothetical protein BDV18DRAFT_142136 [Aspergillus unguis]
MAELMPLPSVTMRLFILVLAILGLAEAQQEFRTQVNISMCNWGQLRAATLRDTVYLDGGYLTFEAGYNTGEVGWESDDNSQELMYYLNFSRTFNTKTSNLTELFGSFDKAGGIGNLAPTYKDGVLFHNNDKLFLYGGLLSPTDSEDLPAADQILAYEAYQYGPYLSTWEPQFLQTDLDDGVTRYITDGAGVSSPSENLGFYISGMHAPGWGPIFDNGTATNLSQRMITVDMSEMRHPVFSNDSIPRDVPARANAEAVWVPVADQGIVVLIGGVTQPESIYSAGLSDSQVLQSERVSPGFMETVWVYDVASGNWYNQTTSGDTPPQLTQFCSTYASASDGSSHNIYIYGGYDGLNPLNTTSDDVYVLSLPSFEWIKLYTGNSSESGRKQHKCVKPYPDQMLVIGGIQIGSRKCIDMIRVFNLNTGRFQDSYNPESWEEYKVPDLVSGRIGGNTDGGATKTEPDSWTNSSLADIFSATYTKTIETYYPYNATTTTNVPNDDDDGGGGGGGFPGWAGAIIGVVLGVLLLAGLFTFWFLRRRKRKGSRRESSVSGRSRVMQWVNAGAFAAPGPKDPDNSTTVSGGFTNESAVAPSAPSEQQQPRTVSRLTAEAGGDPVYEMHGHSATHAIELPTPYNEDVSSPTPESGFPVGYGSPVSPEIPQEKEGDTPGQTPGRPGHQRNMSSLSSVQSYSTNQGYEELEGSGPRRPHYVSGVSEASVSSTGTRLESGANNRGLGLEDIPDEDHHRS